MGIELNRCPWCGKRGGLVKMTDFGKEKVPGSFCKKCGLFMADKQSKMFDVACDGCRKPMHYAAIKVDVVVDGKLVHKGDEPKKFMCLGCSAKRIEKNIQDVDGVLTRHPCYCVGGCGSLQGYVDFPEGTENVNTRVITCEDCTEKVRAIETNTEVIDEAVKNIPPIPS